MRKLLLLLLSLAVCAHGQQTKPEPSGSRIVTATRLVVLFHDLELQLAAAVQKNDPAALDRLLAPDFEVWIPDPPGQPLPRAAWLEKMKKRKGASTFSIRQMAVKGLDNHAIASFVLVKNGGGRPTAEFVVDLWSRSGTEWKLTDRYVTPVPAGPYTAERKPSGKD